MPYCYGSSSVEAVDFEDSNLNGLYDFFTKFDPVLEQALPEIVLKNHPIYSNEKGSCIWWHEQDRKWWIGSCVDINKNQGFAYLNGDQNCPFLQQANPIFDPFSAAPIWRLANGFKQISSGATFQSSRTQIFPEFGKNFTEPGIEEQFVVRQTKVASSAAGVGFTIKNGRYVQLCTWKWTPVGFRCLLN